MFSSNFNIYFRFINIYLEVSIKIIQIKNKIYSLILFNFFLLFSNRHKRKSKDSVPYKASSSTGSPMDPSIVFNGYENPDAFMIRYKTLERQQQHFNVSFFFNLLDNRNQVGFNFSLLNVQLSVS